MTDTPQSPIPFTKRLTPEAAADWDRHLAANRRARDFDHRAPGPCDACGHPTRSTEGIHPACRKDHP